MLSHHLLNSPRSPSSPTSSLHSNDLSLNGHSNPRYFTSTAFNSITFCWLARHFCFRLTHTLERMEILIKKIVFVFLRQHVAQRFKRKLSQKWFECGNATMRSIAFVIKSNEPFTPSIERHSKSLASPPPPPSSQQLTNGHRQLYRRLNIKFNAASIIIAASFACRFNIVFARYWFTGQWHWYGCMTWTDIRTSVTSDITISYRSLAFSSNNSRVVVVVIVRSSINFNILKTMDFCLYERIKAISLPCNIFTLIYICTHKSALLNTNKQITGHYQQPINN